MTGTLAQRAAELRRLRELGEIDDAEAQAKVTYAMVDYLRETTAQAWEDWRRHGGTPERCICYLTRLTAELALAVGAGNNEFGLDQPWSVEHLTREHVRWTACGVELGLAAADGAELPDAALAVAAACCALGAIYAVHAHVQTRAGQ